MVQECCKKHGKEEEQFEVVSIRPTSLATTLHAQPTMIKQCQLATSNVQVLRFNVISCFAVASTPPTLARSSACKCRAPLSDFSTRLVFYDLATDHVFACLCN